MFQVRSIEVRTNMANNLVLPPLNYDPAVVDSPLGAVGGVTSRQAIEAEVDEQLKLFDFDRYIQLQRAKQTEEPVFSSNSVDPYTGEPEVLGYRKIPKKTLSAEEANRKYGMPNQGLTFNEPITEEAAIIIRKRKESEIYNQQLLSEASGWTATKAFGMGILTSLVQPEQIVANVLGSLLAAPVYGAKFTPEIMGAMTVGRRLAARARIGAIEGAVGAVVAEPIQRHFASEEHADYDLWNTLTNLAAGTVLGSGLHVVGGVGADWVNGMRTKTWQDSLNTAIKQLAEGKAVQVEPIVRNDPSVIARNTPNDNVLLTPSKTPPVPEVNTPANEELVASIKKTIDDMPTELNTPDSIAQLKQVIESGHVEASVSGDTIIVNGKKFKADKKALFGEKADPEQNPWDIVLKESDLASITASIVSKKIASNSILPVISVGKGLLDTRGLIGEILDVVSANLLPSGLVKPAAVLDALTEYFLKKGLIVAFNDIKPLYKPSNPGSMYYGLSILTGKVVGGSAEEFGVTIPQNLLSGTVSPSGTDTNLAKILNEVASGESTPSIEDKFLDKSQHVAKLDDNLVNALAGGSISNGEPEAVNQEVLNISSFTKLGGENLSSSNQGAIYVDNSTGIKYFIKKNKTKVHSVNEYIANKLYRALGVDVAKNILVRDGADILLGSELINQTIFESDVLTQNDMLIELHGAKTRGQKVSDLDDAELYQAWVVDAWLANWDAMVTGNVLLDGWGMPVRIDHGGALLFRAQGDAKGNQFGTTVHELFSIPKHNPVVNTALYVDGVIHHNGDAPDETLLAKYLVENPYFKKILALSPGEIHSIVNESGLMDQKLADDIASKLVARQQNLISWAHKSDKNSKIANLLQLLGKRIFQKSYSAEQWLMTKAVDLFNKYTDEMKSALDNYQKGSTQLNAALRKAAMQGKSASEAINSLKPEQKTAVKYLDAAMKMWQTTSPMQVFRWAESAWYGFDKKDALSLVGAKYWDPGYASTSIFKENSFSGRDLLFTINLPAGQNAAIPDAAHSKGSSHFSGDEAEIVLPRDMHYVIRSAEKIGDNLYITLDVLPNKIAGMDLHEAIAKSIAWQNQPSLAADSVKQLSKEEIEEMLSTLHVKHFDSPITLTDKVLSKQEKEINELIATIEKNVKFEFPFDSLDELTGIIEAADQTVSDAAEYARAMIQAAACYTRT